MRNPPDYDAIERERWLENLNEVDERLRSWDVDLAKRINTFAGRFGATAAAAGLARGAAYGDSAAPHL